jgi:hypothetical protein
MAVLFSILSSFAEANLTVQLCALLGFMVAFRNAKEVSVTAYKYFLRPCKNLKKLGEWALVTGTCRNIYWRASW